MSKLNKEIVTNALTKVLAFASGETVVKDGEELKGKRRKFTETIELQVVHAPCGQGMRRAPRRAGD